MNVNKYKLCEFCTISLTIPSRRGDHDNWQRDGEFYQIQMLGNFPGGWVRGMSAHGNRFSNFETMAVFMLETLKLSKTLKPSRDDFNVYA